MKISAGKRLCGPGNNMPGHAAHEAQQGGADGRHKAVAAAAADETLPDGIRACSGRAFIIKGASRAGAILSFIVACGILGAG